MAIVLIRPRTRLWLRSLRALAALVLVVLSAATPAQLGGAYSSLCADDCGDCGADRGASHDDERDCDCPLGCAVCCAQTGTRATTGAGSPVVMAPGYLLALSPTAVLERAQDGIRFEVLHVPRRAA